VPSHFNWSLLSCKDTVSRGQLKCDGTRAETRFRLSAKRTSSFNLQMASVQSTTGTAEVCESAVVMLDTRCSEVVWRVLATHSIRQFSIHFLLPCVITFQLHYTASERRVAIFCVTFLPVWTRCFDVHCLQRPPHRQLFPLTKRMGRRWQ